MVEEVGRFLRLGAGICVLGATLSACSNSASETTTVTHTISEQPTAASSTITATTTATQPSQAPCTVSGYTDKARQDLGEEQVSEQQVSDVVSQGCGMATWDDDGYFEITVGDIEVDIHPDGTVREVDR